MITLMFIFLNVSFLFGQTQTFTSNGTFTVPAGITQISVQAWGGGGCGGTATSNNQPTGGGGGGAYASSLLTVTPGSTYTVTVGSGSATTSPGGDSWFGSTSTLLAKGGNSVANNPPTGVAGGAAASCVGTTRLSGGTGADGSGTGSGVVGGGGGSSAGYSSNGTNGYGITGGSAPDGGGDGGNGGTANTNGSPGQEPGGGGGGSARQSSVVTGGSGAGGQVIVSWSTLPYVSFSTSNTNVAESSGSFTVIVSLSAVSLSTITVPFTLSGTATQNTDYTISSSPLTIPAGSTTATISITVDNDTDTEVDETIIIEMGTPTNAALGVPSQHTVKIYDDDFVDPSLSVSPSTICLDSSVTFTADSPTGDCTNIQNYLSSNDLITWTNITSSLTINGCLATFTPISTGTTFYRYYYYQNNSKNGYSNIVAVTVNTSPSTPGTISGSSTVNTGQTGVVYSVAAVSGATSYTWGYSGSGATINGTSNNITIDFSGSATSGNLTVYASNTCGNSGTSTAFPISVTVIVTCISAHPTNQTVCEGTGTSFSITSTASTFQWQYNTGSGWNNITGTHSGHPTYTDYTTSTLSIADITDDHNGFLYRCTVNGSCSYEVSGQATLTVNPLPDKTFTISNPNICIGAAATFSLSDSENGVSYQLRLNSDNTPVEDPVAGTGSGIDIVVEPGPTANTVYNVLATNSVTGCSAQLSDLGNVTVLVPEVVVSLIESPKCPDLDPKFDFEPNSASYNAGGTAITFRVTRNSPAGMNWSFNYALTLSASSLRIDSPRGLTGNVVMNPGDNQIDLVFYVVNIPGTTITAEIVLSNVSAGGCTEAYNDANHTKEQVISSMPEIGEFD